MIEVKNLGKWYRQGFYLSGINFKVENGTIHGIIGENGSGKTTLIKCLVGIYKPLEGEVMYDGESIYDNVKIKSMLGYVADSNHYFEDYTVKMMADFYKGVYPNFQYDKFEKLREKFKLNKGTRVKKLSKGSKMSLAIVLNLALEPKYLILDEPTSGMDAIVKQEFINLLIEEVEKRGMTVVITSHHLSELEKICDTVTILKDGKISDDDDLDIIKRKYQKFQVIFENNSYDSYKDIKGIVEMKNRGSIYTFILDGTEENPIKKFKENSASFVEEVEMSLEEIFIITGKKDKK